MKSVEGKRFFLAMLKLHELFTYQPVNDLFLPLDHSQVSRIIGKNDPSDLKWFLVSFKG